MGDRSLFKRCVLKTNGMLVVNWANRFANVSGVGVAVGCADDPSWLDGAAHLWEHIVCRRSNTYDDHQVNLMLERYFGGSDGMDINICTTWFYTFYGHFDLRRRAYLKDTFPLMATMVRDAVIEAHNNRESDVRLYDLKGLLVERGAVRNETALYRDDLGRRISDMLHYELYRINPVRRPGDADIAQLRKVTKIGRLKQWAAGHYVPEKMFAILGGPTQKDALELVAEAGLDQLKPYKGVASEYDGSDDMPQLTGVRDIVIDRAGIHQTHVGWAWPTESFLTEDGPALEVLARLMKMRMECSLREENTDIDAGVYHPAVAWYASKHHGLLEAWFSSVGGTSYIEQAEALVTDICGHLRSDTSTAFAEEVEAIRHNEMDTLDYEWLFDHGGLCERIATHISNGDRELIRLDSLRHRMAKVTPEDVRAVANKYLTTERYVRALIRPVFVPQDVHDRAAPEFQQYLKYLLRPAE